MKRERLALNGKKVIVYAGRLFPQKGLVPLLRSAMYVLQKRADVLYAIAGELENGGHSDILTGMVARHPRLKDKVIFLNQFRVSDSQFSLPEMGPVVGSQTASLKMSGKPNSSGRFGSIVRSVFFLYLSVRQSTSKRNDPFQDVSHCASAVQMALRMAIVIKSLAASGCAPPHRLMSLLMSH